MWNHRPEAIWQMTPRQLDAWLLLGLDREKMERAFRLADAATAARSDEPNIKRTLQELTGA